MGGAEEVYAEWVLRAVHLGWTARGKFLKFTPSETLQMTFPRCRSMKLGLAKSNFMRNHINAEGNFINLPSELANLPTEIGSGGEV